MRGPSAALIAEAVAWWVCLTAGYVATLGLISAPELVGAAVAGAGCAVLAVAARRSAGSAWRPVRGWASWLPPLPAAVLADTARLLTRVLPRSVRSRGLGGTLRRVDQPAEASAHRAAFRRAVGTVLVSATPGSVVLDWPADGSPVVLHLLGSGRPAMDEVVTR